MVIKSNFGERLTTSALGMLNAIWQARASAIIAENNILMHELNQFIKDNREYVCRQDPNLSIMEINPYASMYVGPALKAVKLSGIEMFRHSDGATVIAVPKEKEDKLQELKTQIDKMAKDFCTDYQTFKSHMKTNDSVLTIPQDALSEQQLFMLTAELTNSGAFYYMDAENQTLSYLASQQKEVKRAVYATAAELSSKDTNYYSHYYSKTAALYEKLEDLGYTLQNDECMYLVSEDRVTDNGIFALKIENDAYTEIYLNENGITREGQTKPINYEKENDIALLCLQTMKYNKPLLMEQDQFEGHSIEEISDRIRADSFKTYGELKRDNNDKLVVNFIRDAYKNGIKIETYKKDVSDIYQSIKEQCENSSDRRTKAAWESICDIPPEEVKEALSCFKNIGYTLENNVITKAVLETDKEKSQDRE